MSCFSSLKRSAILIIIVLQQGAMWICMKVVAKYSCVSQLGFNLYICGFKCFFAVYNKNVQSAFSFAKGKKGKLWK